MSFIRTGTKAPVRKVRKDPAYCHTVIAQAFRLSQGDSEDYNADFLRVFPYHKGERVKQQLAIAILGCSLLGAASGGDMTLWYRQAATAWTEALPVGNGRLGAMVFGGVAEEHLQLNEDTVWAGEKRDRNNPEGRKAVPEVRRLLFAGKPKEAEALADRAIISIPRRLPPYQTLGDLWLRFTGQNSPSDYRRELDLDQAIARVTYRDGDARFTREVFSSAPDQVLVLRLTCDKPNRISFSTTLTREQDATTKVEGSDRVVMDGEAIARDSRHAGERKVGMKFRAVLLVKADGGTTRADGVNVLVSDANSVTLFLAAETNFRGVNPAAKCDTDLNAAQKAYDNLRSSHVADYQKYFHRVEFHLAGAVPDLPTDERLSRLKAGASDPQLITQYFQFGRYLLISSSRPGSLPATLQGIWNDSLAPPWDSKYTININTEMNYWPAETCDLPEMHQPLFDLIDMARPNGRQVARELYGAHGFVIHHNTDIWGDAVPIDGVGSGIWPMGGAWLSLDLWDHYDFTHDYEFLKNRGYPVLKEAAEFLLDYLVDDGEGNLITGPSISPENRYRTPNGAVAKLCMGPFMDTEITRALFTRVIEASEILGIDTDFREKVAAARHKLLPFRIGKYGQLQEWMEDYDEPEPGHRHISHLFALFPDDQITLRTTPDLAKAARVSLERRLAAGGGPAGWSRAWIVNFWARLERGEQAYDNLRVLLSRSTLPDMLDTHPPFQIDGNFGGTEGIVEMLLQSQAGEIAFLPALPKAWAEGSMRGLRTRGAVGVDLDWSDGRAERVMLHPAADGERKLRAPNGQQIAAVISGRKKIPLHYEEDGAITVKLVGGKEYEVHFR